jgi:hypothetical protein
MDPTMNPGGLNSAGLPINPLAIALMQGGQPGAMNSAGQPALAAQPGTMSGSQPDMSMTSPSMSSMGTPGMPLPMAPMSPGPPIGTMNGGYQNLPMPPTSAAGSLQGLQGRPFGFGSVPLGY